MNYESQAYAILGTADSACSGEHAASKPTVHIDDLRFTESINELIKAYKACDEDRIMEVKASIKSRFRLSDDQINQKAFRCFARSKLKPVVKKHDSVDMELVTGLSYALDGWIIANDIALIYAEKSTGKTSLALAMAIALARGESFLDRSTPAVAGKSMFIATDSGVGPLKAAMSQLALDAEDPIFRPAHKDQMILIHGYASDQGFESWGCDLKGIIQLEQLIKKHDLKLIVIDSAKSVCSNAGWSYTSNEMTKTFLTYLRECICEPLNCSVIILSHDGTAKGSHSGAKAWAEDPSMVISLVKAIDPDGRQTGVTAEFKKDRAASVDPHRKLTYALDPNTHTFALAPDVEKIGSCEESIIEILWDAFLRGESLVRRKDLINEAFAAYNCSQKTVDNTLGRLVAQRKILRKAKGRYQLAPATIQQLQSSNRDLYIEGRNKEKSQTATDVSPVPDLVPDVQIGNSAVPIGNMSGNDQNAVLNSDMQESLPLPYGTPQQAAPNWDDDEDFVF